MHRRWPLLLQKGIDYARSGSFDRPIGQNQGVQFPLARAYALEAADMNLPPRRRSFDDGRSAAADANMAKLLPPSDVARCRGDVRDPYGGFPLPRIRHRAQMARGPPSTRTAPDLDQTDLAYLGQHVLACRARIDGRSSTDPCRENGRRKLG